MSDGRIVLLSGGLGGARLAPALTERFGDGLTVVANVGDDTSWRTLRICPDFDSVLYAVAGEWDGDRGWGRRSETWEVRTEFERRGDDTWFNVGDRDLALHLRRAELLAAGSTLTEAARVLADRFGIRCRLLPSSDGPAGTAVELLDGRVLSFQEWYVREGARPAVRATQLATGTPTPEVIDAIETAELVILGPSNPVSSIGAILALAGVRDAVRRAKRVVAVSPVILGAGTDDPVVVHHALARSRLLAPLGRVDTPESIAGLHADLCDTFVLDRVDAGRAPAVARAGPRPVVASILDGVDLTAVLTGVARRAVDRM